MRPNTSSRATFTRTYRSPGWPPAGPGSPRPASLIRAPSLTPAGIFTLKVRLRRSDPDPLHVGHGVSTMRPVALQFRHGCDIEKKPWFTATSPAPPQTGHTVGLVPGRRPIRDTSGRPTVR